MSLVVNEFENLVLTTKECITKRGAEELAAMKTDIKVLAQRLDAGISRSKEEGDSKRLVVLTVLKKITLKLQTTTHLLDQMKNYKPFYREMDIPRIADILLGDIRSLIHYDDKSISLEKLESDLRAIDSIQEQHRRVLMTFLMQSWVNLREVLILMKICETYKSIAEELVDIFYFMELLKKRL
jgi:hypothetical protein